MIIIDKYVYFLKVNLSSGLLLPVYKLLWRWKGDFKTMDKLSKWCFFHFPAFSCIIFPNMRFRWIPCVAYWHRDTKSLLSAVILVVTSLLSAARVVVFVSFVCVVLLFCRVKIVFLGDLNLYISTLWKKETSISYPAIFHSFRIL